MNQPVGPTKIDEGAEVADTRYPALACFSLGEFFDKAGLLLFTLLLNSLALGEYGPVTASVYFQNL